jgi:hypothetical protein
MFWRLEAQGMPLRMKKKLGKFTLKPPPSADVGRWRIRFSKSDRLGSQRHTLLKVTHGKLSGYFVGLGHEEGNGVVLADYDVRDHLALGKYDSVCELEVQVITGCKSLRWYLGHRDPYVYVPARIAAWSLMLGGAGIVLGLIGAWPAIKSILVPDC